MYVSPQLQRLIQEEKEKKNKEIGKENKKRGLYWQAVMRPN